MNLKTFQGYLNSRGYKILDKIAYGVENDYPTAVQFNANKQWKVIMSAPVTEWKALVKDLKSELGKKYYFMYENGHLCFTLVLKDADYQQAFQGAVTAVTEALRRRSVAPSKNCPVCGNSGCDILVAYKGGYEAAHRSCMEQVVSHVKNKAQKSVSEGNYFTGIIGGILGAIVGVLPSFLSVVLVEKIYALLFALIPLCIYYGYKLLKGKMNKVVIVLTVILSVLSVYMIEMLLLAYYIVAEGFLISEAIQIVWASLLEPSVWTAMTMDALTSFLFVALGIWIAWGRISRTAGTEVKTRDQVMATVTPYGTTDGFSDYAAFTSEDRGEKDPADGVSL